MGIPATLGQEHGDKSYHNHGLFLLNTMAEIGHKSQLANIQGFAGPRASITTLESTISASQQPQLKLGRISTVEISELCRWDFPLGELADSNQQPPLEEAQQAKVACSAWKQEW